MKSVLFSFCLDFLEKNPVRKNGLDDKFFIKIYSCIATYLSSKILFIYKDKTQLVSFSKLGKWAF